MQAFHPATIQEDTIIDPTNLSLDNRILKWTNRNHTFYYQKLWIKTSHKKKQLIFETPRFFSQNGLDTSAGSATKQLIVEVSDVQRQNLSLIETYMRNNAKFNDELDEVWKSNRFNTPSLKNEEKFCALYEGNTMYMKVHDKFEAFDSNYKPIDINNLKQGNYRALFQVVGLQYGEFSKSKPYLCALAIKVLQVVYEEHRIGICYLRRSHTEAFGKIDNKEEEEEQEEEDEEEEEEKEEDDNEEGQVMKGVHDKKSVKRAKTILIPDDLSE